MHAYQILVVNLGSETVYRDFAAIMSAGVESEYRRFIKDFDPGKNSVTSLFTLSSSPSLAILEAIEEQQVDLVAIGARGRSAAVVLLLESITERLNR
jgi:nucleotide-binding universal stress UspA family protein